MWRRHASLRASARWPRRPGRPRAARSVPNNALDPNVYDRQVGPLPPRPSFSFVSWTTSALRCVVRRALSRPSAISTASGFQCRTVRSPRSDMAETTTDACSSFPEGTRRRVKAKTHLRHQWLSRHRGRDHKRQCTRVSSGQFQDKRRPDQPHFVVMRVGDLSA